MSAPETGTTLLFCPATRPERFEKARAAADTAILDLEDAVAPEDKDIAREFVAEALIQDADRFLVRINGADTPWHAADVEMLKRVNASWAMLPKASSAQDVAGLQGLDVVAICESAEGVLNAREIAAEPHCVAMLWGGEDLTADLGGQRSRDERGQYYPSIQVARSTVLFAAGAEGKVAIDAVYLNIPDLDGLEVEAAGARDMGFGAKACIHPSQTPVVRSAFEPTDAQVEWASALLTEARGRAVFSFRGQMVDGPLYAMAQTILQRKGLA